MKISKNLLIVAAGLCSLECNRTKGKRDSEDNTLDKNAEYNAESKAFLSSDSKVVLKVDLDKYAGKWYEIYRYPVWFEDRGDYHATDVTAIYTKKDDYIEVLNSCRDKNGNIKSSKGEAKVVDLKTNSKLSVSFATIQKWINTIFVTDGNYWILDLDPQYRWSIVGGPDKSYLWVLSREKELDAETTDYIMKRLVSLGYNCSKLIKTQHSN